MHLILYVNLNNRLIQKITFNKNLLVCSLQTNQFIYHNNKQQILYQMEANTPKCIGGKDCYLICSAKGCLNRPFMCVDGCQCEEAHKNCGTNFKWKFLKELLSKKLMETSAETKNYLKQVDQIYKNLLKQIQISYNQMKNVQYTFRLNQIEREIFTKLRQNRANQLSGNSISQIQLKSEKSQITIIDDNFLESKKLIDKQSQVLLKILSNLVREKLADSKLVKDIQTISSFFTKKIKQWKLLYRASENNFQVSKFHEKCDGKKHTITILKTQFGNVIGGYTPLAWSSNLQWVADNSMQSFIFSLTNKHKLTMIQGKQSQAIRHVSNWGPIFGGSHDIYIADRANQNTSSGGRPGDIYNNNNEYVYDTQQSYKKWSGQSSGHKFKILQWQVYAIVFA